MGIPAGYEKLAIIGISWQGEYNPERTYNFLHAVYYSGSTYVALKDNPSGQPADDKANWQYMAKGFVEGVMSAINTTDTSGVVGTAGDTVNAQILIDAIADKVTTKLIETNKLVNNFLSTDPTTVLSGPMGKQLADEAANLQSQVTQLNGEMSVEKSGKFLSSLGTGTSYIYEATFDTPFADTNYVVKVEVNTSAYTYYISQKTTSGFKLYVYANSAVSGAVIYWEATRSKNFQ